MASYKVPQDVEADDKLIGPFSFRQFIYLMIVLGAIMVMVLLFRIFPLLAIIPLPVIFFFLILALPLKKDQPMETYLAAIVSFYLKPHRRFWMPGQPNSTILITAPKKVEVQRTRNITGEEAGHRLSFLANIIDTEGYAIKGANSPMRDDFYAEASNANDMFERADAARLKSLIHKEQEERHAEIISQMREAIAESEAEHQYGETNLMNEHVIQPRAGFAAPTPDPSQPSQPVAAPSSAPLTPTPLNSTAALNSSVVIQPETPTPESLEHLRKLNNLARNSEYSVETIQKEADRIRQENANEVYVSLH